MKAESLSNNVNISERAVYFNIKGVPSLFNPLYGLIKT